jgi:release factor glutamine methyltransferase
VLTWSDRRLSAEQLAGFQELLARRAEREPLAYILGSREFYNLDFRVDPRVLIPRPETELLVDAALDLAKNKPADLRIADVGTGSGAIAITLAVHLEKATVFALDASEDCLVVAAENAQRHNVSDRVQFLAGDLLAPLPERVDLLVANLPYVTTEEWTGLLPELHDHEPRLAFDGGREGLDPIRRLLDTAVGHLRREGVILMEIGASQGDAVADLARRALPQGHVQVRQDYAGLERQVIVQL